MTANSQILTVAQMRAAEDAARMLRQLHDATASEILALRKVAALKARAAPIISSALQVLP